MMKGKPLVSVICLCYNHEGYVNKAISSVLNQDYPNVELIIVDDASTDGSVVAIEKVIASNPNIQFIKQASNTGNCTAFNNALEYAKGEYVIDLAADDVLLSDRIALGVESLEQHGEDYGINFTDASYIDTDDDVIRHHYARDKSGELLEAIPQGEVFKEVLQAYFICSPTTMMKKAVLDQLGGYDESLAYEDFDLWVRASRQWKFCYTDKVLVHKRMLADSHGQQQYTRGSKQMYSTYQICLKAYDLCENKSEFAALRRRIRYELKHALWLVKLPLVMRYSLLWVKSVFN